MSSTRGVVYVHSSPSALCPHVEWAIAGVLGVPVDLHWSSQPVERATHRAELNWQGRSGTAAALVSALQRIGRVRFEVTQDAGSEGEGLRYSYTPDLGMFHAITGVHGDILVPEDRIKKAVVAEALGGAPLTEALQTLLGTAWDDELEPFRHAGDESPVRWLHQVV